MVNQRKSVLIIPAVVIGIFLLLFIPIIGSSAQMVMNAVGFRGEEDTLELRNPITIDGNFSARLIVHRDWSMRELTIDFDAEVRSVKVYLIKDGFRSILGEKSNVAKAIFSNSYEDSDGNTVIEPIALGNQLNYETEQYFSDEEIAAWLEIEVRVSSAVTMTIGIVEEEN